jgi:uncharacterized LabA/DUF88 family protein
MANQLMASSQHARQYHRPAVAPSQGHRARGHAELMRLAVQNRQVVRALAYVIKTDTPEERSFFDALEKSGLELKVKDLQVFAGGAMKGDWDVGIAVDGISLMHKSDTVVLACGDGDLIPFVKYLQAHGVIVEALSFGRSTSLKLKEAVNNFIDLDEHRKVLMRSSTSRAPRRGGPTGGSSRQNNALASLPAPTEAPATLTSSSGGMFMPSRTRTDEE